MEGKGNLKKSGASSSYSMVKSVVLHVVLLALLMLVPAKAFRSAPPDNKKELDIVFYKPPLNEVRVPPAPLPLPVNLPASGGPAGAPAPAVNPKPNAAPGPDKPGKSDLPPGPEEGFPQPEPKQNVGRAGILALKDKIASIAQDRVAPRLGAEAKYAAADDAGPSTGRSSLATSTQGSSGGINTASLNRSVGGGGGGGGGGGTGMGGRGGTSGMGLGGGGLPVGRANSSITGAGGDDRPKARGGIGPSRTDEEIQIVFDRYKASFYRLYNRELRNNPTLQGQMVIRLTIEPDGSVSMCALQKTDMDSPELVEQVVARVRQMNFGPKEGVKAVTIVYPIDFLPAA
jgi:hypothetical protein